PVPARRSDPDPAGAAGLHRRHLQRPGHHGRQGGAVQRPPGEGAGGGPRRGAGAGLPAHDPAGQQAVGDRTGNGAALRGGHEGETGAGLRGRPARTAPLTNGRPTMYHDDGSRPGGPNDDFSDLESFNQDYRAEKPFGQGLDTLADGDYDFEIVSAELTRT